MNSVKRYVSLDIARGLALLGIVYAHLGNRDNQVLFYFGNAVAPALFAVLAGMSLVNFHKMDANIHLMNVARGVFFIVLGLTLGLLANSIFIILVEFGLLFIISTYFLRFNPRQLAFMGLGTLALAPILSFFLRKIMPYDFPENASFTSLVRPGEFVLDLFFTGPYPLIFWAGYFFIGMSLRITLLKDKKSWSLLAVSGLGAIALIVFSKTVLSFAYVQQNLAAAYPGASWQKSYDELQGGLFGVTPQDGSWEWLFVYFPHSGTPIDLLATTGFSLAVVILLDKIYSFLAERESLASYAEGLRVFFGLGTMTLSLYTLHVLMNTSFFPPSEEHSSQIDVHMMALVIIGAIFALNSWRGPLEKLERASSKMIVQVVRKYNQ